MIKEFLLKKYLDYKLAMTIALTAASRAFGIRYLNIIHIC